MKDIQTKNCIKTIEFFYKKLQKIFHRSIKQVYEQILICVIKRIKLKNAF